MKSNQGCVREERVYEERIKVSEMTVVIQNDGQESKSAKNRSPIPIVDITPYSALLHGKHPTQENVVVKILRSNEPVSGNRRAYCEGQSRKGADESDYTPLIFDPPLNACDLKNMGLPISATKENNPGLWNLLQQDIKDIGREIQAIERCRSDIFLAIITSAFLVAVTIGCLAIREVIHLKALCLGGVFTFAMFLLGAYATIEKAKVLNMRRALYAILCDYIKQNWLPVTYQGWSKMKNTFLNCGIRRKLEICSRNIPDKYEQRKREKERKEKKNKMNEPDEHSESCLYLGEWQAKPINEAKRFMPGATDSFMSICSYIYTALYIFTIITTGTITYQFLNGAHEFTTTGWNIFWWLLSYAGGLLLSLVGLFRYRKLVAIIFGTILIFTIIGYMSLDVSIKAYGIIGSCLHGFAGFFIGAIGSFLLHNLYALRQGKDSYETYYFAWKKAIEYCTCICEGKLKYKHPKTTKFQSIINSFINKIAR